MTRKQKIIMRSVYALLSVVLVVSGLMAGRELYARQRDKEQFRELARLIGTPQTETSGTAGAEQPVSSGGTPPSGKSPPSGEAGLSDGQEARSDEADGEGSRSSGRNLTELFARNGDCIGWLCIPDTGVDYPVMHTPDNPQKYLRQNFYGEYSAGGVPFMDGRCTMESDNYIIYGHNMKNDTMFGDLCRYTELTFCEEHPVVEFETGDGLRRCEIFAVLKTDIRDEWYHFITAEGENDFDRRMSDVRARSLYQTDLVPRYGQKLLTLSTCYGSGSDGRLLVLAVQTDGAQIIEKS